MAGASLLTLLDDIATLLDDVAAMTKIAAKKTAGVLGDDLALNAQQVSGVRAERELPVVWAVAKGSMVNKVILVPAALFISWIAPWAITPLLMLGGLFLCFEGFEKIAHQWLHSAEAVAESEKQIHAAAADTTVDLVAFEKEKIQGAIRTDFVLSAEIVVISLGTVAAASFMDKLAVLVGISILMTVGVYGFVAAIVKLDDLGLYWMRAQGAGAAVLRKIGAGLLVFAPWLMKALTVVGTAAMFMVGGGILSHGIPPLHHAIESLPALGGLTGAVANGLFGVVAGGFAVALFSVVQKLRS
jgi:predicted DNA repair protein MutK